MARPKLYDDVKKLQKDIDKYFKMCDEKEKPYTMSGLALSLGMDRRSLLRYEELYDEFCPTVKKAKQRVEAQLEENLYRLGNNSGVIFNLKNNFNWKDKMEVETNKEQLNKVEELLTKIKEEAK